MLLSLLVVAACQRDPLAGKWQRFGDDFEGAVIEVKSVKGVYIGKLVKVPAALESKGFKVGDIKWQELKLVTDTGAVTVYEGKDLGKQRISSTGALEMSYDPFTLELGQDGIARTQLAALNREAIGLGQTWRKVR
jgi:hypothetical protein